MQKAFIYPTGNKKFSYSRLWSANEAMKSFLALSTEQQRPHLKGSRNPCETVLTINLRPGYAMYRATNHDLRIAIKADQQTPYVVIKKVMNSLQDLKENRYNLITS